MGATRYRTVLLFLTANLSFPWLLWSCQKPNIIESPRLSSVLVCLATAAALHFSAGSISRAVSAAAEKPSSAIKNGSTVKTPISSPTPIPEKWLPLLVAWLIVMRLELFVAVEHQCAQSGFEAFLPVAVLLRQFRLTSTNQDLPNTVRNIKLIFAPEKLPQRLSVIGSTLLFEGTWLAALSTNRSTFFCSSPSPTTWTTCLQVTSLVAEVAIIEMLWRALTSKHTAKERMHCIRDILLHASLGAAFALGFYHALDIMGLNMAYGRSVGFSSAYALDVVLCGSVLLMFVTSSASLIVESGPALLVHSLATICGLRWVARNLRVTGTWEILSTTSVLLSVFFIIHGAALFMVSGTVRATPRKSRISALLMLLSIMLTAFTYAGVKRTESFRLHPLWSTISGARVEGDRWLVYSSISDSLHSAVREYRERQHGREPPRGFDDWYAFAMEHKSPITDNFGQIYADLLPFWGLKPSQIRESIRKLESEPGIAIVTVKDGQVSHAVSESSYKEDLDQLVEMIRPFSKRLSNLQFAVNLSKSPRVLASWASIGNNWRGSTGYSRFGGLHAKSVVLPQENTASMREEQVPLNHHLKVDHSISPALFQQLNRRACPSESAMRSTSYWNTRDLCTSCFREESQGIFLTQWPLASDICHQPDLFKLHGFFMTRQPQMPYTDLVPVFSRSKPSTFSDILMPWPRRKPDEQTTDSGLEFPIKRDRLFWRGKIEQDALSYDLHHGGHQERLVHLVNNASALDEVTTLMTTTGKRLDGKRNIEYAKVRTSEMNDALPINMVIGDYTGCNTDEQKMTESCRSMITEFGTALEADAPMFNNRYVLITDSDASGASSSGLGSDMVLDALESSSVPFVATIFREWYSERLMPWLHFVPVDIRWHAVHSTLAYFTGLQGRGQINGRDPEMEAHLEDGQWIAEQGSKWARRAMRPEDAQIYLFRLLLEWARITSDDRDTINFVLEGSSLV